MARPKTDIEPRILAAARAAFVLTGVDATSLREVARAAKTSIGMIYYYFPTKNELFHAVVEEVYVQLLRDMELALAADAPVRERIRRLYARLGTATELELTTVRLIVREVLVSNERRVWILERIMRGHVPLVLKTLSEGQDNGELDKELPLILLGLGTVALGTLPQFMARTAGALLPVANKPQGLQLSEALVELLFNGIAAPGVKPPLPALPAGKARNTRKS